jgi:2-haloacid dehalogenase
LQRWATFDCYGTLIDWNGGIRRELARLWGEDDADRLLRRYHELEPEVETAAPWLPYHEVMAAVLSQLGEVPDGEEEALGRWLPSWEPFPEVRVALEEARAAGWKLGILSNTDKNFIEASKARIGVPFEETVVASEIGSYKPAHRHWDEFFARTQAPREGHVHVAASLFHDIEPAHELGLLTIWINRLGERGDVEPDRELHDLHGLEVSLEELVPA